MIASYRDPRYAASIRLEQLRERFEELPSDAVPEELTLVHARRVARTWAGGTAIAGFVAMALSSAATVVWPEHSGGGGLHPTLVLVAAVALSILVYVIARIVAPHTFERRVWASLGSAGDELARLARIENDSVRRAAAELAGSGEKRSIALPMIGVGLLAPLSIHLVVWSLGLNDGLDTHGWLQGFDVWIGASLLLVGIAHIVLAYQCGRFAGALADTPLRELSRETPAKGWGALGYTILAACLPGIVAFAIPVLLVAVTGLLFVPWMFGHMYRRVLQEREDLAAE